MKKFVLLCEMDGKTCERVEVADSVIDAVLLSESAGFRVMKATSETTGREFLPGDFGRGNAKAPARVSIKPDILFSFLVPIVGFIIGAIRLSKHDNSGTAPIASGVLGAAFWTLFVFIVR